MCRLFLLCGFLFSMTLMGQHVKQIPSGFQPISQAAIDAASADLSAASAASIYDIKMIFVTKMEGASDRYQVYQGFGNDYLGFFNTPIDGGEGATEDPAVVHQQLLAAGKAELDTLGQYSMFIVYTTILKLTDSTVNYNQNKHVLYGSGMTGCHKRRFEQIEAFGSMPTDYCVNNTIAVNDAFVNWYAGKLAEATSPEYVVTGTISFQNQVICDTEKLYVNDPHNGEVSNVSDFHPPIVLLVHPEMSVGTVSWSSPTTSANLFTSGTGEFNTLNFPRAAFEQFNTLVANWGGQQTSIEILPVNFQVVFDEDTLSQQGNAIGEITFSYKNNHANFPIENDIIVEVIGPTNVVGAPNEETVLPTPTGMEFKWIPNEDECDPYNIDHVLLANNRNLTEHSNTTPFELKCAYQMVNLQLSIPYTGTSKVTNGDPVGNLRSVFEDETLYVVSTDVATVLSGGGTTTEDFLRDATAKITWQNNDVPAPDDFWRQAPQITGEKEPIWLATVDGDMPALGLESTEQLSEIQFEFTEGSFPPPPTATTVNLPTINADQANAVFNHFFPISDEKSGLLKVQAFEQELEVPLRFLHKNLREVNDPNEEIPPQSAIKIKDFADNPLQFVRGEIVEALPWTDDLIPDDLSFSSPVNANLHSEVYSEERIGDPNYDSYISSKLQFSYDFLNIPTNGQYAAIGPNSSAGSASWAGGAKLIFSAGGVVGFNRKRMNNTAVTGLLEDYPHTYSVDGGTLDAKLEAIVGPNAGGEADGGGGVSVSGEIGLRIDVEAKSTWTLEWTSDSSVDLVISPRIYPVELFISANLTLEIGNWVFTPFGEDGYTNGEIVDTIIDQAIDWLPDGWAEALPSLPQEVTTYPPIRIPISW